MDYAAGYLMKQVNPRCGMVTHMAFDNDTLNETSADIRAHWDGLSCTARRTWWSST